MQASMYSRLFGRSTVFTSFLLSFSSSLFSLRSWATSVYDAIQSIGWLNMQVKLDIIRVKTKEQKRWTRKFSSLFSKLFIKKQRRERTKQYNFKRHSFEPTRIHAAQRTSQWMQKDRENDRGKERDRVRERETESRTLRQYIDSENNNTVNWMEWKWALLLKVKRIWIW